MASLSGKTSCPIPTSWNPQHHPTSYGRTNESLHGLWVLAQLLGTPLLLDHRCDLVALLLHARHRRERSQLCREVERLAYLVELILRDE